MSEKRYVINPSPVIVPTTDGKLIEEHVGGASTGTAAYSLGTLAAEWAYARHYSSDQARANTYQDWIHGYNHHRPHTGIGGKSPIDRVHNVSRNNNESVGYPY